MSKRSKRYTALKDKITTGSQYSIDEAIQLLKDNPTKFDSGVEIHIRLGIDTKKSDQVVRGSAKLPHGTGKEKKVIAFVNANQETEAKEAGADIIGTEEIIAEIKKSGKTDFDVAVATPDMMKKIAPVARILGQRGLMPNPKTETVGPNVSEMIGALKSGKINFKNDDGGNIHVLVGRISFEKDQIRDNINALLEALRKAKPSTSKGDFIQRATLCTSMSPSVEIKTS